MLALVVVVPFSVYGIGHWITAPSEVSSVRASEFAVNTVLVSDSVIQPPDNPPILTLEQVRALVLALQDQTEETASALAGVGATNSSQDAALAAAAAQINNLAAQILALEARIDAGPNTPVTPNPADDVPLVEDDNVQWSLDNGDLLLGDIRI